MNNKTIEVTIDEYARLKDIETRFSIIKEQMIKSEYVPTYTQAILGIEKECAKKKEIKVDLFPDALKKGKVTR